MGPEAGDAWRTGLRGTPARGRGTRGWLKGEGPRYYRKKEQHGECRGLGRQALSPLARHVSGGGGTLRGHVTGAASGRGCGRKGTRAGAAGRGTGKRAGTGADPGGAERGGAMGLPSGSPRLGLAWPLVGLISERLFQRFKWREDKMKRRIKRKEARTYR